MGPGRRMRVSLAKTSPATYLLSSKRKSGPKAEGRHSRSVADAPGPGLALKRCSGWGTLTPGREASFRSLDTVVRVQAPQGVQGADVRLRLRPNIQHTDL